MEGREPCETRSPSLTTQRLALDEMTLHYPVEDYADPKYSAWSIDVPSTADHFRVVAGSKRCAFCDVSVALYERLDDRGEPTGDFHYAEMDRAGREHTPARCVEAREAA